MRSSNCKHYAKKEKTSCKKFAKAGSVFIAGIIAFSAVVIPGTTIIQNVEAVTNVKNTVFALGSTDTFSDIIVDSCSAEDASKEAAKAEKKDASVKKKKENKTTAKKHSAEAETASTKATEPTAAPKTAPQQQTEAESDTVDAVSVCKSEGLLSVISADNSYQPGHLSLSSDQRDKLERLVMGEAGSLGYTGCALVAQAVRDSMVLSGTTSVETIISEYQYTASLAKKPNSAAKKAVAFIFDNDGFAVQHRILYFYACDVVDNPWHESQNFIVSYGNVRFFDKW